MCEANLARLQAAFVALVLPRVLEHGGIYFRHRDPERKEDCIAEMTGLAWKWHVRLAEKGKDATEFIGAIVTFAAKAVNCGRKVAGQEPAKDAMSPRAQKLKGFCVNRLPDFETYSSNPLSDALVDNTVTPPPEQVCFRLDFPAFLKSLSKRDRRVLKDLMKGHGTGEVARKYGMSAARVSQLRAQFHRLWNEFCES